MILRDPVSSASHLFAAFVSIFLCLIFWRLTTGRPERRFWVMVFGFSMVFLYTASGVFHALKLPPDDLVFFQKLDQTAIYCLIAGTYTPIIATLITNPNRKYLLILMWLLAAAGIFTHWLFPKPPYSTTVGLYLGMGWIGFLGVRGYYQGMGWAGLIWGIMGGLFYTAGAILDMLCWPTIVPGVVQSHEVLHFLDMIGTWCHIVLMIRYIIPNEAKPSQIDRDLELETKAA